MKDPRYASIKVILLIIIIAGVGLFAYNAGHMNSIDQSGRVIQGSQTVSTIGPVTKTFIRNTPGDVQWVNSAIQTTSYSGGHDPQKMTVTCTGSCGGDKYCSGGGCTLNAGGNSCSAAFCDGNSGSKCTASCSWSSTAVTQQSGGTE